MIVRISLGQPRFVTIGATVALAELKQVYTNWYFSRAEHEDPGTVGLANFLAETLLGVLRQGCNTVREIREANQRLHEENNRRRAEARRHIELEDLQERQRAEAHLQEQEAHIMARVSRLRLFSMSDGLATRC